MESCTSSLIIITVAAKIIAINEKIAPEAMIKEDSQAHTDTNTHGGSEYNSQSYPPSPAQRVY